MRFPACPALVLIFALSSPCTQAGVLNFDDLPANVSMAEYGGLTWRGWIAVDRQPAPFTAASGDTRLVNLSNDNSFSSSVAFTFQGAHFAGYATVNFELFHRGLLVAVSGPLATTDAPTFLASGYQGLVDQVTIVADLPQFFVMDDVVINSATRAEVAEPGSLALLMGALGVMGALGRRRAV